MDEFQKSGQEVTMNAQLLPISGRTLTACSIGNCRALSASSQIPQAIRVHRHFHEFAIAENQSAHDNANIVS